MRPDQNIPDTPLSAKNKNEPARIPLLQEAHTDQEYIDCFEGHANYLGLDALKKRM